MCRSSSSFPTRFQPTLPARGATVLAAKFAVSHFISTHAPRTGSDCHPPPRRSHRRISTHASRTGSDFVDENRSSVPQRFQPTLPARGATQKMGGGEVEREDFNPRSPHGERLGHGDTGQPENDFNPRSPHGERLSTVSDTAHASTHFNPRSPHGERRERPAFYFRRAYISTHAPRTGSDILCFFIRVCINRISTHAPRTGSDMTSLT